MSPQSIVCTTCDATVPYGRLSCPACGELLASVAGAAQPVNARAATARAAKCTAAGRAAPAVLVDVPPLTAVAAPPGWDATEPDDRRTDEVLEPPVEGAQAPASRLGAPGWEPPIFQPVSAAAAKAAFDGEAGADVDTDDASAASDADGVAARGFSTVAWPADQAPPVPASEAARPTVPIRSVPDAPGAYVPPMLPAEPAGPPAPARAWAGQAAADPDESKARGSRTSMAGDLLDAGRVTEFVGWLAVAGSAMAAVGFLLPWGVSVIGASGIGYFDRWGLAGPFHLIIFVSLLALLALSLARNPIPLWIRVGVLGLGLGALLLGLTWPYLVGLSGTGPGAMVAAVGALVLGAAGVGALASDRHGHEDRAV